MTRSGTMVTMSWSRISIEATKSTPWALAESLQDNAIYKNFLDINAPS